MIIPADGSDSVVVILRIVRHVIDRGISVEAFLFCRIGIRNTDIHGSVFFYIFFYCVTLNTW